MLKELLLIGCVSVGCIGCQNNETKISDYRECDKPVTIDEIYEIYKPLEMVKPIEKIEKIENKNIKSVKKNVKHAENNSNDNYYHVEVEMDGKIYEYNLNENAYQAWQNEIDYCLDEIENTINNVENYEVPSEEIPTENNSQEDIYYNSENEDGYNGYYSIAEPTENSSQEEIDAINSFKELNKNDKVEY